MLREGSPIGVDLRVASAAPGPSPTAQIELLKTFADQAVIAIENVRLFTGARGAEPATSPRRWSSRRRPARSCGSSRARRPTSSRCSTPSPESAARLCEAAVLPRLPVRRRAAPLRRLTTGRRPRGSTVAAPRLPAAAEPRHARPGGPCSSRRRRADPGRPRGPGLRAASASRSATASGAHLAVPMLRDGLPDRLDRRRARPGRALPRTAGRAPEDLRRPGRHRHRERPAVPGARGADRRSDALGRRAPGARRGQPGRQLHARSRRRARDHREPGRASCPAATAGSSTSSTRPRRTFRRPRHRTASRRSTWRSCEPHRSASARAPWVAPG